MRVPRERQAIGPTPVAHEKLLLVEGETPSHFFEALATVLGLENDIEIRNYGGISQLGLYLRTIASTLEFKEKVKSLAIARDAEDNPTGAKQSVEAAVASAGIGPHVSVRIAILPDEAAAGMIETLCVRSIESDPIYDCVTGFFDCLDTKQVALPVGPVRAKHIAQVFMAAKNCPQLFPGTAAYREVWPFSSPVFDSLKQFLTSL
jgi:hypothetical protein